MIARGCMIAKGCMIADSSLALTKLTPTARLEAPRVKCFLSAEGHDSK